VGVDIPLGFEPYRASAFASTFGPVFVSNAEPVRVLGVWAAPRHANSMGQVHGGLLLALGDTALGNFVRSLVSEHALALTVDLHASFMAGARIGQWIEVHPKLDRSGRSMIFVSGEIRADHAKIGKIDATFFIHDRASSDGEERT